MITKNSVEVWTEFTEYFIHVRKKENCTERFTTVLIIRPFLLGVKELKFKITIGTKKHL